MRCPLCKTTTLHPGSLEANLLTSCCDTCGGHWVKAFQYWRWIDHHPRASEVRAYLLGRDGAPNAG